MLLAERAYGLSPKCWRESLDLLITICTLLFHRFIRNLPRTTKTRRRLAKRKKRAERERERERERQKKRKRRKS